MQGIKRGLFANEAGVGSAPNAAASAGVSHPVKQGLVQMLSVYIDTIVICCTSCFCVPALSPQTFRECRTVRAAVANTLGSFGTIFHTQSLWFTTLIGKLDYAETGYICDKMSNEALLMVFRLQQLLFVCFGATMGFQRGMSQPGMFSWD